MNDKREDLRAATTNQSGVFKLVLANNNWRISEKSKMAHTPRF